MTSDSRAALATEDLLAAFEALSPAQIAAIPGAADSLTRVYAELADITDRFAEDVRRIRRLQGRVSALLGRIRDAGPRPFQPSDGRPMPPSAPPATTLPQDGPKEG